MGVVIGVVLLIAALFVGVLVLKLTWFLLGSLVVGLFIGVIARAVLPGRQDVGWLRTLGAGLGGSMGGGLLASALHLGGLMSFGLSVAVAVALVAWLTGPKAPRLP